jgi:hypothetical protein
MPKSASGPGFGGQVGSEPWDPRKPQAPVQAVRALRLSIQLSWPVEMSKAMMDSCQTVDG